MVSVATLQLLNSYSVFHILNIIVKKTKATVQLFKINYCSGNSVNRSHFETAELIYFI